MDFSDLDTDEFSERYLYIQKLDYIRRCRVNQRGEKTRLRLITDPKKDMSHFPRDSRRGLPIRKGLNRSWDKMSPRSPPVSIDFAIKPAYLSPIRSDFGYRNQIGAIEKRPKSPERPRTSSSCTYLDDADSVADSIVSNTTRASNKTGLAATRAASVAEFSVFKERSNSPEAFRRLKQQGGGWNSSVSKETGYWATRMLHGKGCRTGESPSTINSFHPKTAGHPSFRATQTWHSRTNSTELYSHDRSSDSASIKSFCTNG